MKRALFAVLALAGCVAGVVLAGAGSVSAGESIPPPTDGYVSYGQQTATVSCRSNVPAAVTYSFRYDASTLRGAYPAHVNFSHVSPNGTLRSAASVSFSPRPGSSGTFTQTFALSAADKGGSVDLEVLPATTSASYASLDAPVNCAHPVTQIPTPTVTASPLDCSGNLTLSFSGANITTNWDFVLLFMTTRGGGFLPLVNHTLTPRGSFSYRVSGADTSGRTYLIVRGGQSASSTYGGGEIAAIALVKPTSCTAAPPPPAHRAPVNNTAALSQPCAQVLFIGIRGSGQTNADAGGFGAETDAIRQEVDVRLAPSVTLRSVYLDYQSASVSRIFEFSNWRNDYLKSIDDGEAKLRQVLADSRSRCPGERWIIAGYSQGAMVANTVSREYVDSGRIASMVLIADPDRVPNQNAIRIGSATESYGLAGIVHLPPYFTTHAASICNSGDIVCDFSNVDLVTGSESGYRTHVSYAKPAEIQLLYNVGSWAAQNTGLPTVAPYSAAPIVISGPLPLQGDATVLQGSSSTVNLQGLYPNSAVQIVVHSRTVTLGWVHANRTGRLRYVFAPPAGLPLGRHQLVFVSARGNVTVPFTLAARPAAAPTIRSSSAGPVLADTGSPILGEVALGAVLIVTGAWMLVAPRRRPVRPRPDR